MKRLIGVAVSAGLLVMLPTSEAVAGKPIRIPTDNQSVEFAAGVVCPFAVGIEPVVDREVTTIFFDRDGKVTRIEITGSLVARIINRDTGASRIENTSGPGTITFLDDGTAVLKAVGTWLFFFRPIDHPASTMFINSGNMTLTISPDGVITVVSRIGHMEDLCSALA
jgi:hypothetical protein